MPFLRDNKQLKEEDVFIEWSSYNNGFGDKLGDVSILPFGLDKHNEDDIKEYMGDSIRTIITPNLWKFNWSLKGEDELYNLKDDPYELENLAHEEKYGELIEELKDKIKQWAIKQKMMFF